MMFLGRIAPIGIRVPLRYSSRRLFSTSRSLFNEQLNKPKTPPTIKDIDLESPEYKNHPIIKRLPKSMKKYGKRFVNAPVSHLTAFVILHELTALVPFLGLWYAFHNIGFLPTDIPSWIVVKGSGVIEQILGETAQNWSVEERTKMIIEGATAYGIVKAAFPVRVFISLFLTPWFARTFVLRMKNLFTVTLPTIFKYFFGKKGSQPNELKPIVKRKKLTESNKPKL